MNALNQASMPDAGTARTPVVSARNLRKAYKNKLALDDTAFEIQPGRIVGLIGPNGAGKTTLFHVLSGFLRPTAGSITFDGREIPGSPAYRIARLGIGRTFQNIRLFGDLSVLDNVMVSIQRRQQHWQRRQQR